MQVYPYTDEVIDKLNTYAISLSPTPPVTYHLMHREVFVPHGYLAIKITQFFQWDPVTRRPKDCRWAIFIPTSHIPGIGNYYELVGESPLYHIRSTINNYNPRRELERGSHTIGYVLPMTLPYLEAHFARVPVENLKRSWSSQNWVCEALRGLNSLQMFAIGMSFEDLVTQMAVVSAAWEAENVG